jgi:hypothetical protein
VSTFYFIHTLTPYIIKFVLYPNDLIYVTFFFCLGRCTLLRHAPFTHCIIPDTRLQVYCNSLLATLNCRPAMRGPREEDHDNTFVSLRPATLTRAKSPRAEHVCCCVSYSGRSSLISMWSHVLRVSRSGSITQRNLLGTKAWPASVNIHPTTTYLVILVTTTKPMAVKE